MINKDINAFENKTKVLIDNLKSVCSNFGLGNDGNEYKIITQIFLYKFINDKFIFEIKKIKNDLATSTNIEENLQKLEKKKYDLLLLQLDESTARLDPENFISNIFKKQEEENFAEIFDKNLIDIAKKNNDIFSILTSEGKKVLLFENVCQYVRDKPNEFAVAIINQIVNFSFEKIIGSRYDFFASVFEYLIKDYNSNIGGAYAEYFTPHSVSKIMANCLISKPKKNVTCYDPSSGSGTLLMNIANKVGVDKCTIFSQDISQKSSQLLRLNLTLNNLVHSLPNIIEGNTLTNPAHIDKKNELKKFDIIVSNPPFKLNFSEYRNQLLKDINLKRFFCGVPSVPPKKKDGMPIYLLFIQHIIFSLNQKGCAAIVIPTGFTTAIKGIEFKIKKYLVDHRLLKAVINMPSNIFAKTGTRVSILFIDKDQSNPSSALLIDASNLGITVKDGNNEKTYLTDKDEKNITNCFLNNTEKKNFSKKVSYEEIKENSFSINPKQYFDIEIKYEKLSHTEFSNVVKEKKIELKKLFSNSKEIEEKLLKNLEKIKHE